MKKLFTTTLCLAVLGGAFLNTAAAQTPPAPTQIVFVPKAMLEQNRKEGKLKENTFYWSNMPDDPNQGPKVAEENKVPFLLLKGAGTEKTAKRMTVVTLMRAYNIPPGATTMKVTMELKQTYDEWIDESPGNSTLPTLTYSFFKNGIEARKNKTIALPGKKSKEWKTQTFTTDVPEGAQQMVIVAKTDYPTSLGIASMDVQFTTTQAPKQ